MQSLYDYNDYQTYLSSVLPTKGDDRGIRSRLAAHLNCRLSHITQVVQGRSHLSNEMAMQTAEFLKLNALETHFFMLLVGKGRSGNQDLQKYYQDQMDEVLKERMEVRQRLGVKDTLTQSQVIHYYSSWHYCAIHLLCSLPEVKKISDIARRLRLSHAQVSEAVEFLMNVGILKNGNQGLETTNRRIHLESKNKLIVKHHTNWRWKAIEEAGFQRSENLHFSGVYSFAKKDWNRIKELFLNALKSADDLIIKSPEEIVGGICVDFFEIGSGDF